MLLALSVVAQLTCSQVSVDSPSARLLPEATLTRDISAVPAFAVAGTALLTGTLTCVVGFAAGLSGSNLVAVFLVSAFIAGPIFLAGLLVAAVIGIGNAIRAGEREHAKVSILVVRF